MLINICGDAVGTNIVLTCFYEWKMSLPFLASFHPLTTPSPLSYFPNDFLWTLYFPTKHSRHETLSIALFYLFNQGEALNP